MVSPNGDTHTRRRVTNVYNFLHYRGKILPVDLSQYKGHLERKGKETSMKSLLAGVLAALTLAGCVVAPAYYDPYPSGYYYYGPPAPNVYFRYDYHRYRR